MQDQDKNHHSQNSLLCTIAGIHGRFLSIICGILLVFYMYSYEQVATLEEQLNDLRLKVARMMSVSTFSFRDPVVNIQDYFDENGLITDKIVEAFNEQLGFIPDMETEKVLTTSGINVSQTFQYEQHLNKLVSLISIVAHIYPYSTVSEKTSTGTVSLMYSDLRRDWDPQWQRDLAKLNLELVRIWRRKKPQIEKLLRKNELALVDDQINKRSNDVSNKLLIRKSLANIHREAIEPFFLIAELINSDIIPQLNDNSFKLQRHRTQQQAIGSLVYIGFYFVSVLLLGILIPLLLASRPVYSRKLVVTILVISILPYLYPLVLIVRYLG